MLMVMEVSDRGESDRRAPKLWSQGFGSWWLGNATAIAVNLVSGNARIAARVLLVALGISVTVAARNAITSGAHRTSTLRKIIPNLALTIAAPLIIMSALGVWVGYLMFLAALLVAIATSSTVKTQDRRKDLRASFVLLATMSFIAAGALTLGTGFRDYSREPLLRSWLILAGLLEISGGTVSLLKGEELFLLRTVRGDTALRLLFVVSSPHSPA